MIRTVFYILILQNIFIVHFNANIHYLFEVYRNYDFLFAMLIVNVYDFSAWTVL